MSDEQKKLVEDNTKLVHFVIKRNFPTYMGNEDVIQEGMIGLCNAAIKYDETKCQFSTFATICILNAIRSWFKNDNKHNNVLSLDYPVTNELGEITSFGDYIVGAEDIDYIDDSYYKSQFTKMKPLERKVFELLAQGYNTVEVGEMIGSGQANVSRIKRKYEKKWGKHCGNN